jgi:histidine triad (HIT) family protein
MRSLGEQGGYGMSDTIFGKIIRGEIPSEFLYEDEHCIAINDINPQAPVHVLVIPKRCIPRLADAQAGDQALLGHLLLAAGKVAEQLGVSEAFRLVINNGSGAGQTVFHLHLHIIAGRTFSEGHMAG